MTELMKRYEAETGESAIMLVCTPSNSPKLNIAKVTDKYIAWLEAQLRWRPVSENPKEGQIVFVMVSTGWVVAQYLDGGFYVDDGFTFGDFISGVSHWLSIPPVILPANWDCGGIGIRNRSRCEQEGKNRF